MNAAAPAYVTETGAPARDRDAVLALWRGNLGDDARMPAKYAWFYQGCPWGEPLLMLLRHEGVPIGIASAGPRHMLWRGKQIEAGVLVDLAVAPEHRSLGPALMLQQALAAVGRQRFGLLYGFPNPKAAPVFKRVGYTPFGHIVRHARVLRHAGYLARRLPRVLAAPAALVLDALHRVRDALRAQAAVDAAWSTRVDPRIDTLWRESAHGDTLVGVRDCAFLEWRFDRAPLGAMRYLLLSDRGKPDLRAWFACQVEGDVLHVRDFWSIDAATGIGRGFVLALLAAARRAGHAAVSVEYAGADERFAGWRAAGFVERGRRPVFGCAGNCADAPIDVGAMHLTSADEDE